MEYLPWVLVALFVLSAVFGKSSTWSPFQSRQVRDICAHMTDTERRALQRRGFLVGGLLAALLGSMGFAGMVVFRSMFAMVLLLGLLAPVLMIAVELRWGRRIRQSHQRFLATTAWAQTQGIAADEIRLYTWQE